ncbi:MAG: phage tail protein [Acidobacteriota bacterium]|nr:phage tail protein [Acidobacteriota bacterium]
MAGFSDYDSAGTHKFGFTIDGIESRSIKSVDGLSMKLEKVETKSNTLDGKPVHKVWAGNRVYLGQLNITRVMTDDPSWDVWFNMAVKDVKTARKNGVVSVYNQEGLPTREYTFKNAWPIELKVTNMNASTSSPIEETITIVYEELVATNG